MILLKKTGFSLIEVMIVLLIIIVLAVMIMPAYQHYIVRSNRSDAVKSILATQLSEEKYRTNHPAYYSQSPGIPSMDGYYLIEVTNTSPTTYTITAITAAGSAQTSDVGCTTMTLSYANGTTTKTPITCW